MQIYQQYKTHHLQDVFKYVANGLTTFYSNVYLGVVMFHVCHQIMSSTCFKTNDPMVRNVKNLSYTTFFKLVEYTDCNSWTHKKQAWWPFVWNPIFNTHPNNPNLNIQHIFWCTMKIFFY